MSKVITTKDDPLPCVLCNSKMFMNKGICGRCERKV